MSPTIRANLEREAPLFGATNHELKNKTGEIVRQDRTEKSGRGQPGTMICVYQTKGSALQVK